MHLFTNTPAALVKTPSHHEASAEDNTCFDDEGQFKETIYTQSVWCASGFIIWKHFKRLINASLANQQHGLRLWHISRYGPGTVGAQHSIEN